MKRKKVDPAFRVQMMEKGYMNKSELAEFLGCGRDMARETFKAIMNEVKKEGLENIDQNLILTKRAINYLGLTDKQIIEAYERSKSGVREG